MPSKNASRSGFSRGCGAGGITAAGFSAAGVAAVAGMETFAGCGGLGRTQHAAHITAKYIYSPSRTICPSWLLKFRKEARGLSMDSLQETSRLVGKLWTSDAA